MSREREEVAEPAPAREPTAAEAAGPGPQLPAHGRGGLTPQALLALQRSAGNAQTARMVQRAWMNPFRTAPVEDETLSDEQKIEQTAAGSGNDVVTMYHDAPALFGQATEAQKVAMLNLLHGEAWVGPEAEYAMEAIWNTFGEQIAAVADRHEALWTACIDDGAELHTISAVTALRDAFQRDVKAIADAHMASNLAAANTELEALGLRAPAPGQESPTRELEVGLRRQEVASLMERVRDAQAAQTAMRNLAVGYGGEWQGDDEDWEAPARQGPNVWDEETGDSEGHVTGTRSVRHVTAYFTPGTPPRNAPRGTEQPPFHNYAEVQARWDTTQRYIDLTATQSPAVFAAVDQHRVGDAAGAPTPEQALQVVNEVLGRLVGNIGETKTKVSTGEIDYRSLKPIHQQMYSGAATGPSGTRWNSVAARAVGEGVVADEEAWTMWTSLITGLLAAGAFIAAEIFSGGLATPLLIGTGIGLGVGQAAHSWQNYVNLATAAGSAASADTRVATPEQAEEALFQALLDTVFVFMDAAAPAWRGMRAIQEGSQVAAAVGRSASRQAERVGALLAAGNAAEAAPIVRAVVAEHGVAGAIQRTGQSAEELARLFPGDAAENIAMRERLLGASRFGIGGAAAEGAEAVAAADAARRSARAALAGENAAARAFMESGPLEALIPQIAQKLDAGVITREMADQLVLESVERFGPARTVDMAGGWSRLSTALTNESAAAQPFLSWRRGIYQDLKEFAEHELGAAIPDQGSAGAFKNDLDISFMGEHGAANRARARAFVAARAGIADSPEALNRFMMMELFTDPRRLRAYDALPEALRERIAREQTAFERELIPNRDLHYARTHGDAELEQAVLEQMRRDGVREIAYRPLSSGEIERLAQDLDGVHQQLLAAVESGDVAAQEAAARRLVQTQALMNAAEEGGYYSGGSASRYVTNRAGSAPMEPLGGGAARAALSTDEVGAMVDQLSKLNHAAAELTHGLAPGALRDDIVGALRGIGKYGGRAAEVAGVGAPEAGWDALAAACRDLKRAADGGLATRLLTHSPDETVAMARAMLSQVREHSMQALERLRGVAGDLGPGNAAAINQAIRDHVFMLRMLDNTDHFIVALARAARTGTPMVYDGTTTAPSPSSEVGDFGGDPTEGRGGPPSAVPA